MRQFGIRYVIERVGAGPFGIGRSTTRGTSKKSRNSTWGYSANVTPEKKTPKRSTTDMWGFSTGPKAKKKKSPYDFWM